MFRCRLLVDNSLCTAIFSSHFIVRSRELGMTGGASTESTLTFGFLVAFLGIFALGITGGIAWPHLRRTLAIHFSMFRIPQDLVSIAANEQSTPELWDVCVREVVKNARASGCAWEHLRASTPLPLLRL
ncbi:hypothetical protein BD310DRAFT_350133 [Dichomitus squalens]|uniref:Uncharacterized protein n=1 Tax=Dichomitus squalens TaxID=114155 RepID=A0A4Q9Q0V6_9APHY|nr:hypothetical protein BD310DRAFT_350133 [Dichomitus squalens]